MTVDNSNESDQVILATAGYDHTIKLWQTHSGVCLRTMQHAESQVNALAIQPNEPRLAAASYQHIRTYDLHSTNPNAVTDIDIVPKNITSIGYQEDGKWMYSGGEDSQVRIWDMRTSNYQCLKSFEGLAPITCVTLHPNQGELFIGDQSGNIYRWDMKTDNNEQLVPEGNSMILDIAIDPDGTHMAMVNSKGRCYVWSLVQGTNDEPTKMHPKHKFDAHKRQALKCKFSPDSTLFITTSADQTAKIWKTCDYSLLQELKKENQRWVWDAAFSSDSQYVFTASSDQNAKLWNVKTGAMEREYCGHQKAVTALAFRDVSTD